MTTSARFSLGRLFALTPQRHLRVVFIIGNTGGYFKNMTCVWHDLCIVSAASSSTCLP